MCYVNPQVSASFIVGSGSVFSDWWRYALKGFSESATGICSNGVMLTSKSSEPFVGEQKSGVQDWCVVSYRMSFPCQRNRYIHSFGVMLTCKQESCWQLGQRGGVPGLGG